MRKTPFLITGLVLIAGALATVVVLYSQGILGNRRTATTTTQDQRAQTGINLSPRSFSADDFADFMANTRQTGTLVRWTGDWNELATERATPTIVMGLSKTYGYQPIIETQFFKQPSGELLRPLNDANRQAYINAAVSFARTYQPPYLGFGVEVNSLFEHSPDVFSQFITLFAAVYDAVKQVSPRTKIFTSFQLEKMKGLGGGLFGGTDDPSKAEWALFDRFPQADFFAFTSYPALVFKNPSNIPPDYYTDIATHTRRPVAFTEVGWHSGAKPDGWESSEAEQAEFVQTFFRFTRSLAPVLSIWTFMYDQAITEPFASMGLRRLDGTAKPAWGAWLDGRSML